MIFYAELHFKKTAWIKHQSITSAEKLVVNQL